MVATHSTDSSLLLAGGNRDRSGGSTVCASGRRLLCRSAKTPRRMDHSATRQVCGLLFHVVDSSSRLGADSWRCDIVSHTWLHYALSNSLLLPPRHSRFLLLLLHHLRRRRHRRLNLFLRRRLLFASAKSSSLLRIPNPTKYHHLVADAVGRGIRMLQSERTSIRSK